MLKSPHTTLAIITLAALAACSNSYSGGSGPNPSVNLGANNGITQQNFVGVGDSLTFGEQSSGDLGAQATSPVSALPGNAVQATQTNGFWALMWAKKNGFPLSPSTWNLASAIGAPGTSPLPLIKAPGLGSELVVSTQPPGFAPTHSSCDAFNQQAYSSTGWAATRVAPNGPIGNVAVPGMTMHEAITMTAPLTGPPSPPGCGYAQIPGDPTAGALQSLVNAESQMYYPVLGQFQGILAHPTQLNAAVALHPQLVTVWLGGNDMLKCIFSGPQTPAGTSCNSPATDSPAQFATDLTQIVSTLEGAGAKVVIGNLPDILGNPSLNEPPVPQFFPQNNIAADLEKLGAPAPAAAAAAAYVQAHYTQSAGGFLTETGFFSVLSQLQGGSVTPNLDPQGTLPSGVGSGDGQLYIDATFAATMMALNAGYNQAINQIAAGTNSGLADVQTLFQGFGATGVQLSPTCRLTLQFGGGLLGYDGIHPSSVGYALLANTFIGAADTKFSMAIPPLSQADIGGIASNDQHNPCLVSTINPAWPYPLP